MKIKNFFETSSHLNYKSNYQKTKNQNVDRNSKRGELSCTAGGNINWYTYYGEQHAVASKN